VTATPNPDAYPQQPAGPWNDLAPVSGGQGASYAYSPPLAQPAQSPVPPYPPPGHVQTTPPTPMPQAPTPPPVYHQPQPTPALVEGWPGEHVVPPAMAQPPARGTAWLPPRTQTHDRTALSAVLVFAVVVIGLWAGLSYMHAMADTLASTSATNDRIRGQLTQANADLLALDRKTSNVARIAHDTGQLRANMAGIDTNKGAMLAGVDHIGEQMQELSVSLANLDTQINAVADTDVAVSAKLQTINSGLGEQARKVGAMRHDVQASSQQLSMVPPLLAATNARLTHVNGVVCYMGTKGISNDLKLGISFIGIPNGKATIHATMIPPGGWTC
jgi:hypothetical protein